MDDEDDDDGDDNSLRVNCLNHLNKMVLVESKTRN